MAKYESIVTIRGTIDDLMFRKTAEGKVVGLKTGPTREKVLTNERFANTRKSAHEFTQVTRDARFLRQAMGSMLDGVRCTTLNGRVNGFVYAICLQDKEHRFGNRCAAAGNFGMLTGAEFSKALSLDSALPVRFEQHLDAATGILNVHIPSFVAYKRKAFPQEATHFRIASGGIAMNFGKDKYSRDIKSSDLLPLSRKTPGPICLEHTLNTAPGDVLVQVLGIQLFKLENGKEVLVKGGAVKILEAVRVEAAVTPQSPGPLAMFKKESAREVAGRTLSGQLVESAGFSATFTLCEPMVTHPPPECPLYEKNYLFVAGPAPCSYAACPSG